MSIVIELPENVSADVTRWAERAGLTPDAFVADAVRRQVAVQRFRERRERLTGFGRRAGLETDEAVFETIS